MSTETQLSEINVAITAILAGAQEYQIGTRRVRRAELTALLAERDRLEKKLVSETGADTVVTYFDRR